MLTSWETGSKGWSRFIRLGSLASLSQPFNAGGRICTHITVAVQLRLLDIRPLARVV